MATIKSYSDLKQSRKLAKILSHESADMVYVHTIDLEGDEHYDIDFRNNQPLFEDDICAWSLAALLNVLPNNEYVSTTTSRGSWKIDPVKYLPNIWWCKYEDTKNQIKFNISADNQVDACVKMILKLKEKELL